MANSFKKMMNFFGFAEEEENVPNNQQQLQQQMIVPDDEDEEEEVSRGPLDLFRGRKSNVVAIHNTPKKERVFLYEPQHYDDAQALADHLKTRCQVIVNLQRVDLAVARRIIDFLSGTVYALNGSISKLGPNIFVLTPETFEISGSISDDMGGEEEVTPDMLTGVHS
jgi:cell division inhibitor SepF